MEIYKGCQRGYFNDSPLIRNHPRGFFAGGDMIERMGTPFRYKKKERKGLRRHAKREIMAAEKFEAEGTKPEAAATLRWFAESKIRTSRAKRRKKKKSKNLNWDCRVSSDDFPQRRLALRVVAMLALATERWARLGTECHRLKIHLLVY
jgi:hypothetical protein